jgi:hypothetical protein
MFDGWDPVNPWQPHPCVSNDPPPKKRVRWWIPIAVIFALYLLFPNTIKQAWCAQITRGTWIPTARYGEFPDPEIVESGLCLNDEELEEFNRTRIENESFP